MIKVEGIDALVRKLSQLETRSARKGLRKGTRASATIVTKAVKRAAPVGKTKNLKNSIGRKFKFFRSSRTDVAIIGGRVDGDHKGFIFQILEGGTKDRVNPNRFGKGPGSTGKVQATRFAERASKSVFGAAGAAGVEALRKAIETEIARLGSGG